MLKFLTKIFYRDSVFTNEVDIFCKTYKWDAGLFTLLSLRKVIGIFIFLIMFLVSLLIFNNFTLSLLFIFIFIIMLFLEIIESIQLIQFGPEIPSRKRTRLIVNFLKRFISKRGKALGKKEWKKIKKVNPELYEILLSDKCKYSSVFYSLEIAKIITDSILIWGAITSPFEKGDNYHLHAVILRNGYIYDTNMRLSEKYTDFIRLYKFKLYKEWEYSDFSKPNFKEEEFVNFLNWGENK